MSKPGSVDKLRGVLLWLVCVGGCGGGGRDGLEGVWGFGENIDQGCIVEYLFESERERPLFRETNFCRLTDGSVGIELHEGTYLHDGDQVRLTITRSSCPDIGRSETTLDYELSRNRLTLSTPAGALGLARRRQPAVVSGMTTNGCFDDQNRFTPSPVRDL